jgi:TPR repeat protein
MNSSKKYENKYIKYKSKYLKIKNLIQKGGIIPHTLMPIPTYLSLPLSLLAIDRSYFGMLVWLQLCNTQGVVLFNFVNIPQRVPRPFAGVRVYEMSMTHVERQRVVGCGLKGKLVRQLSLSVGRNSEPQSNWRDSRRMMLCVARRIASKQMAAVRNEAAKEAEELCALGQCAAALIPLQQAIDMGHLPSLALKAWLLIDGREGVAKDQKGAFQLAEEGARLGCHHCQGVMAFCYLYSYGCEGDEALSLELARESSGRGSRYGQVTLGDSHHWGFGGLAWNCTQAAAFYRLAAAQGLDAAQFQLGRMHYNNLNSFTLDYAEALRWFQLAAAQGHTEALFMVAQCHQNGQGTAVNVAEAIYWYRRAQAAGSTGAKYYLKGLGA